MTAERESALRAVDEQADLLRWLCSADGSGYLTGFAETLDEWSPDAPMPVVVTSSVANGVPYFVAPDMVALASHAAASMEGDSLHPSDLPSPNGFMYLSNGILSQDVNDKAVSVKAISWMPCVAKRTEVADGKEVEVTRRGVFMAWWSDLYDHRDTLLDHVREMHSSGVIRTPRLILLHYGSWYYGQPWESVLNPRTNQLQGPEMGVRFVFAAWTLMGQRLAAHYPVDYGRHLKKRADKAGLTAPSTVKVVTLRRRLDSRGVAEPGYEPGSVAWSHRWLVGGHWRWQWYPSEAVHKQRYIAPYVKGPESKPLVVKDTVFNWRR